VKTSARGRQLIESFEGCILSAYNDGAGVCTIGYGHTSAAGPPEVHYGMTITKADADQILARDLEKVEAEIGRLVKVPLNQNQFDSLVSFIFNLGSANAANVIRRINKGDLASVPIVMPQYNHAGGKVMAGLTRRRKAEAELWNTPVPPVSIPFPPPPDIPTPEPRPELSVFQKIVAFLLSLLKRK